ncbi:MAG TPA: BsuPI-related putative proteinase inhibitor [Gemmatimonadales bacterium]|nr:BsuPI-related putative proteinase inhibitor [Gemmatimonadales bacterium]
MPLLFQVANAGRASVTLQLQGREPTADFRVFNARGRQVWSLLQGRIMLGSLRLYPLAAGQRLSFRHSWNQRDDAGKPVPAGDYLLRGVLITDAPDGLASPPARLRIQP